MKSFQACPNCGKKWQFRSDFIYDPEIEIIGYQVHYNKPEKGFFLFRHSCQGLISARVEDFSDMYNGLIYPHQLTDTDRCPGYCRQLSNLEPCPQECSCSYVREIIQLIK